MKYQDDITELIAKKLKASKDKVKTKQSNPNHHVYFGSINAASNPEYSRERNEEMSKKIGEFEFANKFTESLKIEEGSLPKFNV